MVKQFWYWWEDNQVLPKLLMLVGILGMIASMVLIVYIIRDSNSVRTCADYAGEQVRHLPVECLSYWMNKR